MYLGDGVVRVDVNLEGKKAKLRLLQLVGAVARLVHAMSLFEQLEELFNRDARVGGAP